MSIASKSNLICTVCTFQRTFYFMKPTEFAVQFIMAFNGIQAFVRANQSSTFYFVHNIKLVTKLFRAHYLPFKHG